MSNVSMDYDWYSTPTAKRILHDKYMHEGENCAEDIANRLQSIFVDKELGKDVKKMFLDGDFLLGGRSIYGAGSKGKFRASMSNCFTAGHKVITKRGIVNIEDVKIGDVVITHDGSWQHVNNVMCRPYVGDMYRLKIQSSYEDITCTPNHRFLTNEGWIRADRLLPTGDRHIKACHRVRISPIDHYEKSYRTIDIADGFSDEIIKPFFEEDRVGYKVQMRHNDTVYYSTEGNLINRYIKPDEEFMYFIGRWIGDGSITTRKGKTKPSIFQIVFNATTEKEAFEKCKAIGESKFGLKASVTFTNQNVIALRFENPIISTWFLNEFGQKHDGKFIKPKYDGDFNIALGMLDSDGMIYTHGAVSITLKNKGLIYWLKDTLFLNGINPMPIHKDTRHDGTYKLSVSTGIAKLHLVPFMSKTYHDGREGKTTYNDTSCNYTYITSIEVLEDVETTVYNLSVEHSNSYTVNGVVCHNCYISPSPVDNIENIMDTGKQMARIFSMGGGVGVNFSNLRPNGARVHNSAKTSTGPCSYMAIYDAIGRTIGSQGRRAAMMFGLNCEHPDIEELLELKQNTDQIKSANISILFNDKFMEAVENNEMFELHFEVNASGDKEVISKMINAREFFMKFAEAQFKFAEPRRGSI